MNHIFQCVTAGLEASYEENENIPGMIETPLYYEKKKVWAEVKINGIQFRNACEKAIDLTSNVQVSAYRY